MESNKMSLGFAESIVKGFARQLSAEVENDRNEAGSRALYRDAIEMGFWKGRNKVGNADNLVEYLNQFSDPACKRMAATYWVFQKMNEIADEIETAWDNA